MKTCCWEERQWSNRLTLTWSNYSLPGWPLQTVASSCAPMAWIGLPCMSLFSIVKGTLRVACSLHHGRLATPMPPQASASTQAPLEPRPHGWRTAPSRCCTVLAHVFVGGWRRRTNALGCLTVTLGARAVVATVPTHGFTVQPHSCHK